jgi:hypothetical protein
MIWSCITSVFAEAQKRPLYASGCRPAGLCRGGGLVGRDPSRQASTSCVAPLCRDVAMSRYRSATWRGRRFPFCRRSGMAVVLGSAVQRLERLARPDIEKRAQPITLALEPNGACPLSLSQRDRSDLSGVSDEFGEAIALTIELGGVFGQFNLACAPQLEQRANEDESFDLKEDALDLLIPHSSSLLRCGAAARLRRSMLRLKKLVHVDHLSIHR